MGCCSSTTLNDSDYYNSTRNNKRNYASHTTTNSSSGVSSACTSPLSRTILSRISPSSENNKLNANITKPNTQNRKFIRNKRLSTVFEKMRICEDYKEAAQNQQQQQENKSFGYYSESISSESTTSQTPTNSCLKRTQDDSLILENPMLRKTRPPNYLKMEMYMMSRSSGLMPKTSSPIVNRKIIMFDAVAVHSPSSHSYHKWASYLQNTPTYLLHNVTDIPEAIAGHFSPFDFPAFTNVEEMERATKKLKDDTIMTHENPEELVYCHNQTSKSSNITHTVTTDL